MIELLIINRSKDRLPRKFLTEWMGLVEASLRRRRVKVPREGQLVLVFMSKPAARKLNLQYRGRDYATDVLSFEDGEGLGELVLCVPVLKRQSLEHELPLREEMGYMLLHGLLHLLGYDHEGTDAEAEKMFKLQDAVFEELRGRASGSGR